MNADDKRALIENLTDADCSEKEIRAVMTLLESGRNSEGILKLRRHRSALMNEIHMEQKKVDCLDYLINKLGGK